ncbi:hypothetical protein PR048_003078 [Dryococelus australis]|uniref:Uncharacterized protein n=1 Tax=Dryococelus australis TaxID=614101 RepID=A0ABQ9IP96_9NEOP|nr:hypothetical protein PR048_003078 [Dryococelus australis]
MKTTSFLVPAPSDMTKGEPSGSTSVSSAELTVAIQCCFCCKDFTFKLTARDMKFIRARICVVGCGKWTKARGVVGYLGDVVHEAVAEHPVELELIVLEDVLQASLGAVLCEQVAVGHLNACAQEPDQVVVGLINASGCPCNGVLMHVFMLMEGNSNISSSADDKLSHITELPNLSRVNFGIVQCRPCLHECTMPPAVLLAGEEQRRQSVTVPPKLRAQQKWLVRGKNVFASLSKFSLRVNCVPHLSHKYDMQQRFLAQLKRSCRRTSRSTVNVLSQKRHWWRRSGSDKDSGSPAGDAGAETKEAGKVGNGVIDTSAETFDISIEDFVVVTAEEVVGTVASAHDRVSGIDVGVIAEEVDVTLVHAAQREHCTPVQSLAHRSEVTPGVRVSVVLIAPALPFLKREGKEIRLEMVRGEEKDTREDGVLEKEEGKTKDEALKLVRGP